MRLNKSLNNELNIFALEFEECKDILLALGDTNLQHMILGMIKIGKCSEVRVHEIVEKTHLSRASVSHHLRVLKEAGIVKIRKEPTKNYYYFDPDMKSVNMLIKVLQDVIDITSSLPDRSEIDE